MKQQKNDKPLPYEFLTGILGLIAIFICIALVGAFIVFIVQTWADSVAADIAKL